MRFAFVCDAGQDLGSGHVGRCLSVAEVLRDWGHEIAWFADVRDLPWLSVEITRTSDSIFSPQTNQVLEEQVRKWTPDLVLVDSYVLPAGFGERLESWGIPLASIDDPATPIRRARLHWSPGFATDTRTTAGDRAAGPHCVLLRSEFRHMRHVGSLPETGDPWEVGILMGGTGQPDLVAAVVAALRDVSVPLRIHTNISSPQGLGTHEMVRHQIGPEYWQTLLTCHFVVSAAGVSSWELLHVGVPTGLVITAENQRGNYWGMTARGWALGLGAYSQLLDDRQLLASGVADALTCYSRTLERAAQARSEVDGLGAVRLAGRLQELSAS